MVSRSYAAPIRNFEGLDINEMSQNLVEKIMLGVTTYLWECLLTGDVRKEEVIGSDSEILEELLVKTKQYGRQIIRDDKGTIFVLDIYEKPVDPMTLPMRSL